MFELIESDRLQISRFIEEHYGIKMPASKKILLQTRLQKRATQLGYTSIHAYVQYLFSPQGTQGELDHFAGIVSTHKTEFFREIDHFHILRSTLLPQLLGEGRLGRHQPLRLWSAASSTGEEGYSLAMLIDTSLSEQGVRNPHFSIDGTDISEDIVTIARRGIYTAQALQAIPVEFHHYLMRSKDPARQLIRVVPELRCHMNFQRQNLMDQHYAVDGGMHIIFCRNVLIYFDKPTQESILHKLVNLLTPGGYLFIGHSESITGMQLPLLPVQPTVYKKQE